jgi:hypothetical protein
MVHGNLKHFFKKNRLTVPRLTLVPLKETTFHSNNNSNKNNDRNYRRHGHCYFTVIVIIQKHKHSSVLCVSANAIEN